MEQEIDWLRESAKAFAKLKNIRYDMRDYTEGQHKFTILRKTKVNLKTGETKVLFSALKDK